MDEGTTTPAWLRPHGAGTAAATGQAADRPEVVHRYRLGLDTGLSVSSADGGWYCTPERTTGGGVGHEEWVAAQEGDGAAQAFVDLLRYEALPRVQGFRVVRLVPPPEATGERAVDPQSGPHTTVVVGERVVVTWTRRAGDALHPGPLTLEHLAAHGFMGVPDTYGLLLWRSPAGHEVPVAAAARYLPRSRDGRLWAAELLAGTLGDRDGMASRDLPVADVPARLGRLTARLHGALATPSAVVPVPSSRVDGDTVRAWHAAASELVDAAGTAVRSSSTGERAGLTVASLPGLAAAVDVLERVADEADAGGEADPGDPDGVPAAGVAVQRVHGDLHVGRVLLWPGGLAVVGFDTEAPETPSHPDLQVVVAAQDGEELQPATRDLARLLSSLGALGDSEAVAEVRAQVVASYLAELRELDREDLFDARLLAAFEAEQACRRAVEEMVADLG